MAKTSVTINFSGLALCYKKNNKWKLLLPFESGRKKCHRIVYSNPTPDDIVPKKNPLAKKGRKIDIIHQGKNGKPIATDLSDFPNSIVDFTASYAHGTGKQKGVSLKKDWFNKAVELTLNSGTFSIDQGQEKFAFALVEDVGEGNIKIKQRFSEDGVAVNLKAEIELNKGESLILKISDKPDEIFEYIDGGSHQIIFDNDCSESLLQNEYDMYYDLMEDKPNVTKKFELHWIPPEFVDTSEYKVGKTQTLAKLKQRIKDARKKIPSNHKNRMDKTNPCGKGFISNPNETFPG